MDGKRAGMGRTEQVLGRVRTYRSLVLPGWDLVCVLLGSTLAAWLLRPLPLPLIDLTINARIYGLLLSFGVVSGLYRGRWTVASFSEVRILATSYAAATVAEVAYQWARGDRDHDGLVVLATLLSFSASGVGRAAWRVWYERFQRPQNGKRVIIVVDGEAGLQMTRGMLLDRESEYLPVAIIDGDPMHAHRMIMGIPVAGTTDEVSVVARRFQAEAVIVGAPHLPAATLGVIVEEARNAGCEVLIVPPLGPSDDPTRSAEAIRPLTELDLLQRREVSTDWAVITAYLRGKRVLVTGAGGSIGSELCRQIVKAAPASLVKLDRDESALQATQLSIEGHGLLNDPTLVVADIRDASRLLEVFRQHRPEIVFHAAALKHLSLLEMHPSEAVKTNVDGTQKVIAACADINVERFVNISTDKAADPTSVLGYSKRIGERITATYAISLPSAKYLSVRFGNVIGSRGSVIHSFRAQAANGGPLTVTHPDVTRFFMTVEEAVLLVIQAGGIGRTGEALILDMGEPIRIDDVARRVAASVEPAVDITYTGLRPGEKMHEVLFGAGEIDERPEHPLISHVRVPPLAIANLEQLRYGLQDEVRAKLAELAGSSLQNANVISFVTNDSENPGGRGQAPRGLGAAAGS